MNSDDCANADFRTTGSLRINGINERCWDAAVSSLGSRTPCFDTRPLNRVHKMPCKGCKGDTKQGNGSSCSSCGERWCRCCVGHRKGVAPYLGRSVLCDPCGRGFFGAQEQMDELIIQDCRLGQTKIGRVECLLRARASANARLIVFLHDNAAHQNVETEIANFMATTGSSVALPAALWHFLCFHVRASISLSDCLCCS